MKYNLILIFILIFSCTPHYTKLDNKKAYNAKGFAYIYNEDDFNNKVIKGRLNNDLMQLSHSELRLNTLVKLINPKNKKTIIIKNYKKTVYPNIYKILITKPIADELELNPELPLVEIIEVKKNKSFVAKKAKIFNEEKKISSKAPVASVKISNISKNNKVDKKQKNEKIYILIASFYSKDTAKFLKKRIGIEIPDYDIKKLIIRKKSSKEIDLISGPYNTINLMKNDYIQLTNFGFEELNIFTDD